MKKIIIIAALLLATAAYAGIRDYPIVFYKGVYNDIQRLEANTCPLIANIESSVGVDLKGVTENQVDNYFKNQLPPAKLTKVHDAVRKADAACEGIASLP